MEEIDLEWAKRAQAKREENLRIIRERFEELKRQRKGSHRGTEESEDEDGDTEGEGRAGEA